MNRPEESTPDPRFQGEISLHEVKDAIDAAFDYRGDVTLVLKSGEVVEGYLFDRQCDGLGPEEWRARLIPRDRNEKLSIRYSDIERIEFTGPDMAAGRSYHAWMEKRRAKKPNE